MPIVKNKFNLPDPFHPTVDVCLGRCSLWSSYFT